MLLPAERGNSEISESKISFPEVRMVALPQIVWPAYAASFGGLPCNHAPDMDVCIKDMMTRQINFYNLFDVVVNVKYPDYLIQIIAVNHLTTVKIGDGNYFISGNLSDWREFILMYAQNAWPFSTRLLADAIMIMFEASSLRLAFGDLTKKQQVDKTFIVKRP